MSGIQAVRGKTRLTLAGEGVDDLFLDTLLTLGQALILERP